MTWKASITIHGLYASDPTLFAYFYLPEGISKPDIIDLLMQECSSFEILYPSPEIMKQLIGVWSKKCLPIWEDLYASTLLSYDPLNNYVLHETVKEDTGKATNSNISDTGSDSRNVTDNSTQHYGGTTENVQAVAGFNSETFSNANKANVTNGGQDTANETKTETGTNTNTTSATGKEDENRKLDRYKYGMMGGVKPGTLIKDFRDISRFDVYDYIVGDFIKKFCLMVY